MTMQTAGDDRYKQPFESRLRQALDYAGVSVADLAEELDVHRNTVGAWINGRNRPRRRDLRLIAVRTGFALEWLETGKAPTPKGGGQMGRLGESNPGPIHYTVRTLRLVA